MTQTLVLLALSQENLAVARDYLSCLKDGTDAKVEDKMYAYVVASDWFVKLSNNEVSKFEPTDLFLFENIRDSLAGQLLMNYCDVKEVFCNIDKNVGEACNSSNPVVQRLARMYYRSLEFVADLFANAPNGAMTQFNRLLHEKIPEANVKPRIYTSEEMDKMNFSSKKEDPFDEEF